MPDTKYKVAQMRGAHAGQPAVQLSWPAILYALPWGRAIESQDTIYGGRRTLLNHHTGGSNEWQVGSTAPGLGAQSYPDPDVWRRILVARTTQAPGQRLEMRAIVVPCGMTQRNLNAGVLGWDGPLGTGWQGYPQGKIRIAADYTIDGDTGTVTRTYDLPVSPEVDGYEATEDGWSWDRLGAVYASNLYPDGAEDADEAVLWQEWPTVDLTLSVRGGARVVHVAVQEVPHYHTTLHSSTTTSAHDAQPYSHQYPRTKAPDGATYDEHRYGTRRAMDVAARQDRYAGPVIFTWGSHSEEDAEVTDTDPDPISCSSTSWQALLDNTQTAWSAACPGWDICAAYCRATPTNLDTRLRGNAATVPVRLRVFARFTTNAGSETGYVRLQTSARSWTTIEVAESSSYAWYTTTAYVEANATVLDAACIAQVLLSVTGGTMETRYISAQYGAYTVEG